MRFFTTLRSVQAGLSSLAYALLSAGKYAESQSPAQELLAIFSDMGVPTDWGPVQLALTEIPRASTRKAEPSPDRA